MSSLLGFVLSIALLVIFTVAYGQWTNQGTLNLAGAGVVGGIAVVGLLLGMGADLLLWRSFRELRAEDRGFERPALFVLGAMLGMLLVLIGVAVALGQVLSVASCAGGSNTYGLPAAVQLANCVGSQNDTAVWGLLIGGVVLWAVGLLGTWIGVRRLALRLGSRQMRTGAALQFIPFVGVIGTFLLFLNARRLEQGRAPDAPVTSEEIVGLLGRDRVPGSGPPTPPES